MPVAPAYQDGQLAQLGDVVKGRPDAEPFEVIGIIVRLNDEAIIGNCSVEYGLRAKPAAVLERQVSLASTSDFTLVCR